MFNGMVIIWKRSAKMIEDKGDEQYLVHLSSGEILDLSEDELMEMYDLIGKFFFYTDEDVENEQIEVPKGYNKREKIIELFNQYKSKNKTKSEVFRQISNELKITYKAVEKAYYKK